MPLGTVLRPADRSDPYGEWIAVRKNLQNTESGEKSPRGEDVLYRCGFEDLRVSISCKFQCEQPRTRSLNAARALLGQPFGALVEFVSVRNRIPLCCN
jgi:hypothetical protein